MSSPPAKFTLRFRNARTHEMLGVLAERWGMSRNQLAEEMLERELQAAALLLEQDLTGTLEALRNYRRGEHLDGAIAAFAHAEAYEDDPVRAQLVDVRAQMADSAHLQDAFGIAQAFA
jgi:hypothetical protein